MSQATAQPTTAAPTESYPAAAPRYAGPRLAGAAGSALGRLRADRWTGWHALVAAAMALVGIAATFPAWADIYLIAKNDEENSHIFLVPLVALWMVWVRRMRIRHCKPVGTLLGVVMAALGWLVASYGYRHGHQSLWHGGSVMVVIGCVVSILGKQALFRFLPAIAVLVFMIPVPGLLRQRIAIPLQVWTAEISEVVMDIAGIGIERSGSRLSINGVPVNIVEACNGLRMVFALILVSYAFSFGLPLRNSVRFLILLASPLAAIFCNVVRILPTIWIYGFYSKTEFNLFGTVKTAGQWFHDSSGWLMLPVSFCLLMVILKVMRWAMIPVMRYTLAS